MGEGAATPFLRRLCALAVWGGISVTPWSLRSQSIAPPPSRAGTTVDARVERRGPSTEKWYRGNLHTHSVRSDGNELPSLVVEQYRRAGYQFLALTEHDNLGDGDEWRARDSIRGRAGRDRVAAAQALLGPAWAGVAERNGREAVRLASLEELKRRFDESEQFLLLPGAEITDRVRSVPVHVNAIGLENRVVPAGGRTPGDALAADARNAIDRGRAALAIINHPNFHWALGAEDLANAHAARFVEIASGHPATRCDGDAHHASVAQLWDEANYLRLERGLPLLFGVAVDDAHEYFGRPGSQPGRGWISVRARELTAAALFEAMLNGDFYASTGVVLSELYFEGRTLSVGVQPHARDVRPPLIEFVGVDGGARGAGQVFARIEAWSAVYELRPGQRFVRAVVTARRPAANAHGDERARAWTQPVRWRVR